MCGESGAFELGPPIEFDEQDIVPAPVVSFLLIRLETSGYAVAWGRLDWATVPKTVPKTVPDCVLEEYSVSTFQGN